MLVVVGLEQSEQSVGREELTQSLWADRCRVDHEVAAKGQLLIGPCHPQQVLVAQPRDVLGDEVCQVGQDPVPLIVTVFQLHRVVQHPGLVLEPPS